jgi:peptide/nickel transport system permease protein
VKRDRGWILPLGWLTLMALTACLAPALTSHSPLDPVAAPLDPARAGLPLGADALGRDLWARLAYGARTTLLASAAALALTTVLGSLIGLAAATMHGWPDRLLSLGVNAALAIPGLLLAMLLVAGLGTGVRTVVLAIGLSGAPGFARVARTLFLQLRERGYVTAAGALGAGPAWSARRHILPNARVSLIALVTTHFAWSILGLTTLSFLGLTGDPSWPEWGGMMNAGRQVLFFAPGASLYPGAAIALTILAVQDLGRRLTQRIAG